MNKEILTLYEAYFRNRDNFKIFLEDLQLHHCVFCRGEEITQVKHCKTNVNKIILQYLNHLKLISCSSWEKVKYFFKSVRISGFLDDNCIGKWKLVKWQEKDIYILCHFSDDEKECVYFT